MAVTSNTAIFSGYYKNLAQIAEFIQNATTKAGFDSATSYHIELAVDEAVSNIIEHAYKGEGNGEIECTYEIDEKGLTIILKDHGQPFNAGKFKPPDIKAPLPKRENHGLGLFIIRQVMDEIRFHFEPSLGNTLTLVKLKESKI